MWQSVAGSLETIQANTQTNNVRGGHTVHSSTDCDDWATHYDEY